MLRDLKVGEKFILQGKLFTKINTLGEVYGICNCMAADGNLCHIEPTNMIDLLNQLRWQAVVLAKIYKDYK